MFRNDTKLLLTPIALSLALLGQGVVCSETLTIYDDEAEFLRDAPIVSTEKFEDLANLSSPTAEIVIDEVVYSIHSRDFDLPECERFGPLAKCWSVGLDFGAISPPNVLYGSNFQREWATLSFGQDKAASAVGFFYAGGVQKCGSNLLESQIRVIEVSGAETKLTLSSEIDPGELSSGFLFVGLISETGIVRVETEPDPSWDGMCGTLRGSLYDNVSRSELGVPWLYVSIDIKPGNDRNAINPRSKGRFWTAILSGDDFDPLQIEPESVAFGPGAAAPDRYKVKDANADRLPDLMLRFRTPEVGLQCGDTELELTGETYAGDNIIGTDKVKTVGCKKKPKKGKKK